MRISSVVSVSGFLSGFILMIENFGDELFFWSKLWGILGWDELVNIDEENFFMFRVL